MSHSNAPCDGTFKLRALSVIPVVLMLLLGLFAGRHMFASSPTVAVLYPDVRDPYRRVFLDIIAGMKAVGRARVKSYVLEKEFSPTKLREWLRNEQVQAVISLGTRGRMAARELRGGIPVVVGAVLVAPEVDGKALTGITLSPDPEILLQRLKSLAPSVTRVTVVYNPQRNEWLIAQAREVAATMGMHMNALPAGTLREAAAHYRDYLKGDLEPYEAIWLLQDPSTVDEQAILPSILKKAWSKNLIVFSSNPSHVDRGILFALYPDNKGMGRTLVETALGSMESEERAAGIVPLRDLLVAVNVRTAEHLGFRFSSAQQREFDLIFPLR